MTVTIDASSDGNFEVGNVEQAPLRWSTRSSTSTSSPLTRLARAASAERGGAELTTAAEPAPTTRPARAPTPERAAAPAPTTELAVAPAPTTELAAAPAATMELAAPAARLRHRHPTEPARGTRTGTHGGTSGTPARQGPGLINAVVDRSSGGSGSSAGCATRRVTRTASTSSSTSTPASQRQRERRSTSRSSTAPTAPAGRGGGAARHGHQRQGLPSAPSSLIRAATGPAAAQAAVGEAAAAKATSTTASTASPLPSSRVTAAAREAGLLERASGADRAVVQNFRKALETVSGADPNLSGSTARALSGHFCRSSNRILRPWPARQLPPGARASRSLKIAADVSAWLSSDCLTRRRPPSFARATAARGLPCPIR